MGEFKFCVGVGVESVNWAADSSPNTEFGSIKIIPITLLIAQHLVKLVPAPAFLPLFQPSLQGGANFSPT